ncbi:MAG: hypothetical protein MUE41_02780 [Gemmatimonadaceae bacterium]|nr:hypothetical protein [Gemmatimonadaceae bacterium]
MSSAIAHRARNVARGIEAGARDQRAERGAHAALEFMEWRTQQLHAPRGDLLAQ